MKKHYTFGLAAMMVAFFVAFGQVGNAQGTYTSIADGDWDDDAIWSLNGVDPCSCSPATNIDGFDVYILHEVSSSNNLHIKAGSALVVEPGGSLLMPDKELNVQGGSFICDGYSHIGKFDVGVNGYATFTGPATIETKFNIVGTLELMFGEYDTLKVMSADVKINPSATFQANLACVAVYDGDFDNSGDAYFDNASVCVISGDIINKSMLSFSANTCMTGFGGTFDNKGTVTGQGALNMGDGEVDNSQGDWSGVEWCAAGGGSDVPMEENCEAADSICELTGTDVPLPIKAFKLHLRQRKGAVELHWTYTGQKRFRTFEVHRAHKDFQFRVIGEVPWKGYESVSDAYEFIDFNTQIGATYYRIAAIDEGGMVEYSAIQQIDVGQYEMPGLHVHPNPTNDRMIHLRLAGISETVDGVLSVYDPAGRLIQSQRIEFEPGLVRPVNLRSAEASGYCIVQFRNAQMGFTEVLLLSPLEMD